jgi:hypothetical protein
MSGCDFDTLESLAFEELTPALADAARAHVAGCAACARELDLLRVERGLFAARAQISAPLPGFSAALARSRWSSPAVVPAKPPPAPAKSRFPWAVSAFGVAAAAAFAGLFFLPFKGPTLIEPPAEAPIVAEPASEDFCHDEAFYSGVTVSPRSPTVCEMPEPAAETNEPCGGCSHEAEADGIDSCDHDSSVTETCSEPLHD